MKKIILKMIISFTFFILYSCSSSYYKDITKWEYFAIQAKASDSEIFVLLQDELGIDPKLESYLIIIDVKDKNPQGKYLIFGDEATGKRFKWSKLSKKVQNGLLKWKGSNKYLLE